jgi:uncharacterized protein YfdQ (DUF2303 family)
MGNHDNRSEIDAAIEAAKALHKPELVDIGNGHQVLVAGSGLAVHQLKAHLDAYNTHPERRTGTAVLEDIESLVLFANRFKDADSVLYAHPGEPSLTVVIDYHRKGEDTVGPTSLARYGQHRGKYTFPLAPEWSAWVDKDGEEMGQADFAEFIESHVADLDGEAPTGAAAHFAALTQLAFASPARIVELSKGLSVRSDTRVKNHINLSSGETQLVYETTHVGDDHGPLKVPGAFLIAVPVFRSDELYQLAVRLRYRTRSGAVSWILEPYQHARCLELAFDKACDKAADQTALPLLYGAPER